MRAVAIIGNIGETDLKKNWQEEFDVTSELTAMEEIKIIVDKFNEEEFHKYGEDYKPRQFVYIVKCYKPKAPKKCKRCGRDLSEKEEALKSKEQLCSTCMIVDMEKREEERFNKMNKADDENSIKNGMKDED